jgi:PAS domain S-box-containing protein
MIRFFATFIIWPLLLILLTFTAVQATGRPKIIVGGDQANPPYEFIENGKPTGFNIELIRAVSETLGFDVEFRLGPWSKVRQELEQGKIDALAGMYYSPQRSQRLDFSLPHTMVTPAIFVRQGSPIQSLEDIKGKEVIVQQGDVIHDYLRDTGVTSHIVTVTNPADELRLLASGRHDCALMPSRFQGEYLKRTLRLTDLRAISTDLPQFRYCFAVRKGNQELRYRLDEGLNILKVNGRYQDIYEKWFGVYEKRNLWATIKYYVLAAGLSLALFLGFLIWSWMLKKRVELRTTELHRSEEELRQAHDELEKRVEERTADLQKANELLQHEIAERNQAEEALLLSRFCIDKAGIGIYRTDGNGTIYSANDYACASLGYSKEELCALSVFDIDPAITPEKMIEIKKALDASGSATHETIHRRKDGTTFPVEITANLLEFHGNTFGISFIKDITERKRAEEALRESESRVRRKLDNILDPVGDIGELDLADIIDAPEVQALMDDLYHLAGLKMSIIDLKGRVLVDVGWQDICSKFHRAHPETRKNCHESDTDLTVGVPPGEFRTYRCKNNMWHLVTPIIVGGRHMGNLFMGQFFFDNEQLDYDLFRSQSRRYGFPEEEYISALEAVPRYSEEWVNMGKAVFLRLTDMFSKLSYANIKLARSLTERDQLTATLRQANLVVENSPVVLFRCKAAFDWPVELVSRNVIQFGYTPEEFLSGAITYSSIIHPQDLERVISEMKQYTASGVEQLLQEYRIVTKGGNTRWIIDQTFCERNEAGEITHYQGVIFDVTDRKRAEEALRESEVQLKQKKQLLEELNSTLQKKVQEEVAKNREKDIVLIQQNRQAALGEMFDHIAHQWKQPLNSIAMIIQYLGSTCTTHEQVTSEHILETVDSIMDMVGHMAQTVDVFRNFYNPDKEKSVFLIKDSIDKALSFVTPVFRRYGIEVDLDADPELLAFGYPKEYAQVLLNILANAKDAFTERVVENPRINIKAFADGDNTVVTITDNAGGVPDLSIESIFDLNFTTKESSGGTGIGLYMSKNIIEKNMGGRLSVCNVEQGAQFRIELGAR